MTKKMIWVAVLLLTVVTASFATTKAIEIVAKIDPGIKVSLDGKQLDLKSADGQPVHLVVYNGTTYLPVRAFSNAFGLHVDWDSSSRTVVLKSPAPTDGKTNDAKQSDQVQITPGNVATKVGDIVFQNETFIVKYAGIDFDDDDDLEAEVKLTVKNLTRTSYRMTAFDVKINGKAFTVKLQDDEEIDAFETEEVEVELKKDALRKSGISKPTTMEFRLKFEHRTAPLETPVMTIRF